MAIKSRALGMEDDVMSIDSDLRMETPYERVMKARALHQPEPAASVIPSDTGSGALQDPTAQKAPTDVQQVSSMGEGSSEVSQIGDSLTTAGAATMNPKLVIAGLAVKTAGMAFDRNRQMKQDEMQAKNAKIIAKRAAAGRNIFA